MNTSLTILFFHLVMVFFLGLGQHSWGAEKNYRGSSFPVTWGMVKNMGAYDRTRSLPRPKIGFKDMVSWINENISDAANRTISDRADILPNFQKLVHANGICFSGTWNITEPNPYSGYFSAGSKAAIIVRVSEASGNPLLGGYRSFGIAGKLYPTANLLDRTLYPTANFQTIDDLGGTKAVHATEVVTSNAPSLTPNSQLVKVLSSALSIAASFRLADSHINERQLYEISELGVRDIHTVKTPTWMTLRVSSGTAKVARFDFRNELLLENYGGKLIYDIQVASAGDQEWQRIGYIELTDEALSVGCDHNLHFHHPKWRKNLR